MTRDIYYHYKCLLLATIICMVLFSAGTGALIYFVRPAEPVRKNAVREMEHGSIADTAQEITDVPATQANVISEADDLILEGSGNDSEYIWIPVESGITSSDIMIENHYMDRQLWVAIENGNMQFYKDNPVTGNLGNVILADAAAVDDRLVLKFSMDRVYEYDTIFENGVLYVKPLRPKEAYDRIVIIDPAGSVPDNMTMENSMSPSSICRDIAVRLQSALEENGIKVYMTSVDDRVAPDEDSLSLATDVRPDMYIRIEISSSEDSSIYGTQTVYNGSYFIPGFGSVELADYMEAYVTKSIGGKAMGLVEAGEEDVVIGRSTVPAAAIKVGFYTNAQENVLLNREDYRTRIAEGLTNAVMEAYGK